MFVRNLSALTTAKMLTTHFGSIGPIQQVQILRDKNTNKYRHTLFHLESVLLVKQCILFLKETLTISNLALYIEPCEVELADNPNFLDKYFP